MKSVDRDFDANGIAKHFWTLAYVIVALGAFAVFGRFWDEIHLHGLPPHKLIRIVALPLIYLCPIIFSLAIRRYIRCALKEKLVSERVANNCGFFIGQQLIFVYIAILLLAS
jgi:hypothetical protein